jgi:hypothetical protein
MLRLHVNRSAIPFGDVAKGGLVACVYQGRYREEYRSEEYRSELYELAAAGMSRWRQALYAARLLDRSWQLRAELRAPAVQGARP